eukprot:1195041-Prorocentrum_minimum.AAC.2
MEAAESRGLRGKRRAGGCPRERTGRARSLRRSLADQARHIVAVSHRKRHLNALACRPPVRAAHVVHPVRAP